MNGSSRRFNPKKGPPGDQVCMQLAGNLKGDPLMWMMHVNKKSDYDDDDICIVNTSHNCTLSCFHNLGMDSRL